MHYWEAIYEVAVAVVHNFYYQSMSKKSFNSTIMALIPKKLGSKEKGF